MSVSPSGSEQQMPTSEAPANLNEQNGPTEPEQQNRSEEGNGPDLERSGPSNGSGIVVRGSRWVDYDTHELLEMISELEDERRWARLREGALWAFLFHVLLLFAIFLIPKYLLRMTPAIETSNIRDHKDFTYLDTPTLPRPKAVKPLVHPPTIDRKTLEDLRRENPPAPAPPPPPPPAQQQAVEQPKPQPTQPIPPNPQSQSQVEAPRPASVPARPNFAGMMGQNPVDQLQKEMQNAAHSHGGQSAGVPATGGLPQHPGAGGGLQILSDTQGVDFSAWMRAWYFDTYRTWDPLIPDEVNPPISKQGQVMIRFKVLPNGRLMDGSVVLEGRSGDVALDRAAWGALTGSGYPPLPRDFHGPYLELRALFLYNMQPPQ
jgi:outer membrane biosynthesis protein TonB